MKRFLPILAIPVVVVLLAANAGAGDHTAAARSFLAAYPGAELVPDPGGADRAFIVRGFRSAPLQGDRAEAARGFALAHRALLGLDDAAADLALQAISPHRGNRYYQFAETLHGLEVFQVSVIVGVDGDGRVFKLTSKAVGGVAPAPQPTVDRAAAEIAAAQGIVAPGPAVHSALGWLEIGNRTRLVWLVVTPAAGLHRFATYVDARTGVVVFREDLVKRHQANVFPENPVVDDEATSVVDLPNLEDAETSPTGSLARTATCTAMDSYGGCSAWAAVAVADGNGFLDIVPDLEDPTGEPDAFAEISAYYYLDRQSAWMRAEFGYAGQYVDPNTSADADWIWAMVNMDWANAAYSGAGWGDSPDMIIIGQGALYSSEIDFAYDADVVAHEFNHSVAAKAFQLGMGSLDELGVDSTVGGVEEGNADYFAVSRHGNPQLSEYALGPGGRNADNDNVCPDDLWGESHYDGEIVVGALWELRTALGATKVDHLEYSALASTNVSTFADYAEALLAAAEDMTEETGDLQFSAEDVDAVSAVIDARGLGDCERIVDLWVDGATVERFHYGAWDITDGQGTPSAVQYRIATESTTQVMKLIIDPLGDKSYDVLLRAGSPVSFEWDLSGYPFSWEATFDGEWTGSGSDPLTEVKISNATEIAIEPGTAYYVSLICRPATYGCQSYITAELSDTPEEVEEDGGADTDTDTDADTDTGADAGAGGGSDTGCGCSTGGAASGALLRTLFSLI